MISAVAFVPCAPVLVPELAGGAASELDGLRAAVTAAVTGLGRPTALVGPGPVSAVFGADAWGTLAPYGRDVPAALDGEPGAVRPSGPTLPPALGVAARLAAGPGHRFDAAFAIGPDIVGSAVESALQDWCVGGGSLVVAGDGSARRSASAPGYLDDRAAGYDAACVTALASGDPGALARLDVDLGTALLAAGPPVWTAVGRALAGTRFDAGLDYDDAPYGVGYVVARWTARTA